MMAKPRVFERLQTLQVLLFQIICYRFSFLFYANRQTLELNLQPMTIFIF